MAYMIAYILEILEHFTYNGISSCLYIEVFGFGQFLTDVCFIGCQKSLQTR